MLRIQSRPESWRVTQVSVKGATAPAGSTCTMKKNGVFVTPIIATGGVAAEYPPVDLYRTDELQIEFTSQTPGTLFEIFMIYSVIP